MAFYQTASQGWAEILEIINDPAAFLNWQLGYNQWTYWDPNVNNNFDSGVTSLFYVGFDQAGPPPVDFPDGNNLHLAACNGFDHYKLPDSVTAPALITDWNEVIKPGRYGRGKCARIDTTYWLTGTAPAILGIGLPRVGFFVNGDQLESWSMNSLTVGAGDLPNGYNCVLPWTQRMHVYQMTGGHMVFYSPVLYDGGTYDYIQIKDGAIKGYTTLANYLTDTGITLATGVPVNQWYSLELRTDPTSPLLPAGSPANGPYTPISVNFKIKVNDVAVYDENGLSQALDPSGSFMPQFQPGAGREQTFIDNYYVAFLTQEGQQFVNNSTWIIDGVEVVHDECVGAWTGYDVDTATKFRGNYTDTVKMATKDYIIQRVENVVYDGAVVVDGLYSKFTYNFPTPRPGTVVATYGVLLGDFFSPYGFPWILQGKTAPLARRDPTFPFIGVDNAARYTHTCPFSSYGLGTVINQFLPYPAVKGNIRIGVDIEGYS